MFSIKKKKKTIKTIGPPLDKPPTATGQTNVHYSYRIIHTSVVSTELG